MFGMHNNYKIERDASNHLLLETAYERAEKELTADAVDIKDFVGVDGYGEKTVRNDEKYVEDRESLFKKKMTPQEKLFKLYSEIFEAITIEQLELNWLGANAKVIKTSKYDDIKNGIDAVIEFEEQDENSHLALAIDVTFNQDTTTKLDSIKENIDSGKLAELKYPPLEFELLGPQNIPRVVIGIDKLSLNDLIEKWVEGDKAGLANHPAQDKLLGEINIQLREFAIYARNSNQPEIAEKYEHANAILENIIKERGRMILEEDLRSDNVFDGIYTYARNLNK